MALRLKQLKDKKKEGQNKKAEKKAEVGQVAESKTDDTKRSLRPWESHNPFSTKTRTLKANRAVQKAKQKERGHLSVVTDAESKLAQEHSDQNQLQLTKSPVRKKPPGIWSLIQYFFKF